jgi:hypothetical protein
VGARAVLDEVSKDALLVVTNEENLANLLDFGDSGEAV